MRRAIVIAAVVGAGAVLPAMASAQAPALMPVQGYLTDDAGAPIDGSTSMTFSLYDVATSGTALYTETQDVLVEDGYFTAYVGDVTTLDLATFRDNGTIYVGIAIGSDGELSPRTLLGSVPYAGYAEYAGAVDWDGVAGAPSGLADGDDDTTYTAGTGLELTGTTFAVDSTAVQTRVSSTCSAGSSIRAIAEDGTVTCETDDGSSYAAGSGLTLTGTTFAVDTSAIQARVSGTCSAGSSIRAIAASGAVTCEADDDTNTTYSAGSGLSLSGTTFSVDTSAVQARVSGTCSAGSSIRVISATGTVTCEPDSNTTYTAGSGLALAGTTFSIATGGVTSTHVADGTLTAHDMQNAYMASVSSTTNVKIRGHYTSAMAGVTQARVTVAANGFSEGGAGTLTVYSDTDSSSTYGCSGTAAWTRSLGSGGANPWTYVSPAINVASGRQIRVCVRASSGSTPVLIRSLDVDWL